ncbi:MAG: UPF0280 family protein [Spirochaetes bacterium]|nr:UPF0280 family protein [Spirochaetota bacterium]
MIKEILLQRRLIEGYIRRYPQFLTSLVPIPPLPNAPPIALAMHSASELTGVGPMAAVAGAIAEYAARAGGGGVVENGGDIFLISETPVVIGLYGGKTPLSNRIGFRIDPERMPMAVCSSSGKMGHSLSFGKADLVTIFSKDGALADAAATLGGNLVQSERDIESTLVQLCQIPGIEAAWIEVDGKVGFQGNLPPLVRLEDREFYRKITRDVRSGVRLEDL